MRPPHPVGDVIRYRLYVRGHTDREIAAAEGVKKEAIMLWRQKRGLPGVTTPSFDPNALPPVPPRPTRHSHRTRCPRCLTRLDAHARRAIGVCSHCETQEAPHP